MRAAMTKCALAGPLRLRASALIWPRGMRSKMRPPKNHAIQAAALPRAAELFDEQWHENARRIDRMFAVLMILQWFGAIAVAVSVSPVLSTQAWNGSLSQVHPQIWLALI